MGVESETKRRRMERRNEKEGGVRRKNESQFGSLL